MKLWLKLFLVFDAIALLVLVAIFLVPVGEPRPQIGMIGDVEQGQLLLQTAGCFACHTQTEKDDAFEFAGGPKLTTPFGDFYAPNITSSEGFGLGDWTLTEFEAALRQGRNRQGLPYYPAFPFLSYRSLTDADVANLFAALQETTPIDAQAQSHDLSFPFNIRIGLKPWRWLFASTTAINIDQSTAIGRGRYLVDAVAHCGECHNPRNSLGAFVPPYLGGNREIPGGVAAPPIHTAALLRMDWTEDDLYYFLADGMLPDGDYVGGSMVEVVDYATSKMSDDDRRAIATYLFSLK